MAHFAELDENNIVTRVVVIDDEHELDGETWCNDFFNGGTWKQTSYNNNIRKNYASIGAFYNTEKDAFIEIQPYPSWILDEDTCQWHPPVSYPSTDIDKAYEWDEATTNWKEIT